MKLEILLSTMNKRNLKDLELDKRGINQNCLVINQITDERIEVKNDEILSKNIRMLSFKEKGLSKSRNRALENAKGEICLIVDDDLVIKSEYIDNILSSFNEYKEFDIITFQSEVPEGGLRKKYSNQIYKHKPHTLIKVSSIEIAFKRKTILKNNIKFDEDFGCGSKYPAGEEIIFLKDCFDKKLNLLYVPKINSCHEIESTGTKINSKLSDEVLMFKGALAKRLFKKNYRVVILLLYFKFLLQKKIKILDFKYIFEGGNKK